MKKAKIFSMLTIVALLATSMFVFNSCEEDAPDEKGDVKFSFSQVESNDLKSTKAEGEEPEPAAVLVTIENAAGEAVYENEKIQLYNMSGSYISDPISLLTGDGYELTKFIVLNSEDDAIYASPLENSSNAYLVENPLPNEFDVVKDEATKITPEVLSTEESTPEDFGYATFSLNVVETFDFLVGVFVYDETEENFVMTSANMAIQSEGETLYTDTLAANTNTITVNDGYDNYVLTVEKEGYQTHVDTFTNEELKSYYSSEDNGPLEIVLTKPNSSCPESVTDIEGNVYDVVEIGNQCWMAENLKTTKYNDGSEIPNVTDSAEWVNLSTGAYVWYNNNPSNGETYGALYNWYAVGTENLCPDGWHVPSDEEWKELEMQLGMSLSEADTVGFRGTNEGSKLAGNASLWDSSSLKPGLKGNEAFGESGFAALPGGSRFLNGEFNTIGNGGRWWSSTKHPSMDTDAYNRYLYYYRSDVYRANRQKTSGYSVRCVKN